MADQPRQQRAMEDEAATLAALMAEETDEAQAYEVIEAEKPKRKRKPKPQTALQVPYSVVVGVAALLIGFMVAAMIALAPAQRSESSVVAQPVEQSVQLAPNPVSDVSNSLVDRWMLLPQSIGEIAANSFVRVLSQDNSPEFYNVADMAGHLAIVQGPDLRDAENAPSESVYPPLGPYSAALGQNQKLLVTVEWNGDLAPGTLVYAMGWRVEDGTWVYEVSPDRTKIYYLPSIHLVWANGAPPSG